MSIWDDKSLLNKLEKERHKNSKVFSRQTIECFNLLYKDETVICSKGKHLGLLSLEGVLGGKLSLTCRNCSDYNP